MLTIRNEQLSEFDRILQRRFEERMMQHLREIFPKQMDSLGEGAITVVRHGIVQARAHQIHSERDVAMLIDLYVGVGRECESQAWIRAYLDDPQLPGEIKMRLIYEELPRRIGSPENGESA